MKKLNQKESPVQTQFLLAAWLISEPYSVLPLCWAPHNETHGVNGCSAVGLSETTAGVCLNEVLMGRQVHVNAEQEGRRRARREGRAVWPQSTPGAVTELSANCPRAFDTSKSDLKGSISVVKHSVLLPILWKRLALGNLQTQLSLLYAFG